MAIFLKVTFYIFAIRNTCNKNREDKNILCMDVIFFELLFEGCAHAVLGPVNATRKQKDLCVNRSWGSTWLARLSERRNGNGGEEKALGEY